MKRYVFLIPKGRLEEYQRVVHKKDIELTYKNVACAKDFKEKGIVTKVETEIYLKNV